MFLNCGYTYIIMSRKVIHTIRKPRYFQQGTLSKKMYSPYEYLLAVLPMYIKILN